MFFEVRVHGNRKGYGPIMWTLTFQVLNRFNINLSYSVIL